ncbi:hypothetical protein BPOR_0021g00270 [Botrytis porri]|uniref:Uncharacterized protein n=1 Tax=Botrytis porri TaxID=87229 RepID=A0A4Z1L4G2_9HELO|nr:hypothetical protein BPOR_0021g00270 [Botrytis porri]
MLGQVFSLDQTEIDNLSARKLAFVALNLIFIVVSTFDSSSALQKSQIVPHRVVIAFPILQFQEVWAHGTNEQIASTKPEIHQQNKHTLATPSLTTSPKIVLIWISWQKQGGSHRSYIAQEEDSNFPAINAFQSLLWDNSRPKHEVINMSQMARCTVKSAKHVLDYCWTKCTLGIRLNVAVGWYRSVWKFPRSVEMSDG